MGGVGVGGGGELEGSDNVGSHGGGGVCLVLWKVVFGHTVELTP